MSPEIVFKLTALVYLLQAKNGVTLANYTNTKLSSIRLKARPATPYLDGIECGAHEHVASTDPDYHRYVPYYVKLLRCQGASAFLQTPLQRRCMPAASHTHEVNITVYDRSGAYITITLLNHTKCEYRCIERYCSLYEKWNNATCQCDCDPTTRESCKTPKIWDKLSCCICPPQIMDACTRKGMDMDEETCFCVTKTKGCGGHVTFGGEDPTFVISKPSKKCMEDANLFSVTNVVLIVVFELIIVVVVCFLVFYYCCNCQNTKTCYQCNPSCLNTTCFFDHPAKMAPNDTSELQDILSATS